MIGVFDSGYGGLTILEKIRERLPEYDYLYLGDNARAPYGTRSLQVIYQYTLQAVRYLFERGCTLVILACNTASADALRTIQQRDLPEINHKSQITNHKSRRVNVLGVIRPTVEAVPQLTRNGHVGILATPATVASESYVLELDKIAPLTITQQACPLWVPLIEAGEYDNEGADWFVDKYLTQIMTRDPEIDTLVLGCTHYPLLYHKITRWLEQRYQGTKAVQVIAQGELVAESLEDYLRRHPEYEQHCTRGASCRYLTTESAAKFADSARLFIRQTIIPEHIQLNI